MAFPANMKKQLHYEAGVSFRISTMAHREGSYSFTQFRIAEVLVCKGNDLKQDNSSPEAFDCSRMISHLYYSTNRKAA